MRRLADLGTGRAALIVATVVLCLGGLATSAVWATTGGGWDAAVSWRKPTLFCFASGVTCLSLAWVVGLRRRFRSDPFLLTAFAVAIVVEVGLITLQQARGVPSHFNDATAFDAAVLWGIKGTVGLVTAVIAIETVRVFGTLRVSRDMAVAARAGMVLLLLSCLIGFAIELRGEVELDAGRSPQTYGEAGVMKFPHGVPMHAIQVLPVFAWGLRRVGVREVTRERFVAIAVGLFVAATGYAVTQTLLGIGRIPPSTWAVAAGAISGLAAASVSLPRSRPARRASGGE